MRRCWRVQGIGGKGDCDLRFSSGGRGGLDADGVARRGLGVEGDDDLFGGRCVEREAGVVGGDGHEAAATVDEDGEFDLGGAAVVEEFVEGGFDGAAGKEDVVDEDHGGAVDVGRDVGGGEFLRDGMTEDVVAVEGDVDGADGS